MTRSTALLRLVPLLAAVVLSLASAPVPSPKYSARRAALVPQLAPPMRSGVPMETRAALSLAAPGVANLGAPGVGGLSTPGVELPRWSLSGAGRLRLTKGFDMGGVYERGSAAQAYAISEDQPAVNGGDTYGYGLSMMASGWTGVDGLHFSLGLDLLTYSVPYVEYRTCVEECEDVPLSSMAEGRTRVPVFSFSFLPSWRHQRWTFFGGITARNQPTIDRGGVESGGSTGSEVSMGDVNVLLSAGAEYTIGHGLSALAMVYQPFEAEPVDYTPTFAVGLTYAFGTPKPKVSYGAPAAVVAAPAEAERASEAR